MKGLRRVSIAGGGLAGLSLGIALRKAGVPVTVYEAGNYPRHKVCGEFISGVSPQTLSTLGISTLFGEARSPQSLAWFYNERLLLHTAFPQPALGISRYFLDERLQKLFTALNGDLQTNSRQRPDPAEGHVWAAGRRPQTGPWLGLKAHVKNFPQDSAADLEMHMGSNGYVGIVAVEEGYSNVCGLFRVDRSLPAKGSDLLPTYLAAGGNVKLAEKLRACQWREDSFSAVAGFKLGAQPGVSGLCCIGDSESMIPPFTGNGMSMAFQAAELALAPLLAWSSGAVTWENTTAEIATKLRKKFRRRLLASGLLHQAILSSSGRSVLKCLAVTKLLPFQTALALVR